MKGRIAPRILAVPLFVALAITPAVTQQGLVSFWSSWGGPLLASAAVFAVLAGLVLGSMVLATGYARRRVTTVEDGEAEVASEDRQEPAEGEQTDEAGEEAAVDPEVSLADALSELKPENFMDLARALQEMGRDADTLEVLARVVEGQESGHGDEIAEALRRLRQKLSEESPGGA